MGARDEGLFGYWDYGGDDGDLDWFERVFTSNVYGPDYLAH